MKIIKDDHALIQFLLHTPTTELEALVQKSLIRVSAIYSEKLSDLLTVIIVERGDEMGALERQLGFGVTKNRWNGITHDAPGFTPSWNVIDDHENWYEMTFVISDDGYGVIAFVPKGLFVELDEICKRYVSDRQ